MIIKKRCVIVFIIAACIIILIFNNTKNSFANLKGSIITGERNEEHNYDVFILNLETGNKIYVDESIANNSSFAENSGQLFVNDYYSGEIYLYDVALNKKSFVAKVPYEKIEYIKYIDKNNISFFAAGKIILFNTTSKEEKIIANTTCKQYSYNSKEGKFYYSANDKIYEADLKTGIKKYVADGYNPEISSDGNILAYTYWVGGTCHTIVTNLSTGEVWKRVMRPYSFVLSPDGEYLLIRRAGTGIDFRLFYNEETVIYDYKNKKELEIVGHGSCDFVLDWI